MLSVSVQANPVASKFIEQTDCNSTSNDDVTGTEGTIYLVEIDNTANDEAVFLKIYDDVSPTVGTTEPDHIVKAKVNDVTTVSIPEGLDYDNISFACVTTGGTEGTDDPEEKVVVRIKVSDEQGGPDGDETQHDIDIYLDAVNGSDETGNGTQSLPFKDFPRAFLDIPYKIRHRVRFFPSTGTYTFPQEFSYDWFDQGRTIIDASHNAWEVLAGPFTVGSVTDVTPPTNWGVSMVTDIQASGTPGWTTDQYYGRHMRITSGFASGYVIPIQQNTSDTIRTYPNWYVVQPGDTFEIVKEPVIIAVDHGIHFKGNSLLFEDVFGAVVSSPYKPHFLCCGLRFEVNPSGNGHNFIFEKIVPVFSFCSLVVNNDRVGAQVFNASINNREIPLDTFTETTLSDWFWYSLNVLSEGGERPSSSGRDFEVISGELGPMSCSRYIVSRGGSNNRYYFFLCGGYGSTSLAVNFVDSVFVEQIGYLEEGMSVEGFDYISSIYIERSGKPIEMRHGGWGRISWLKGNAGNITASYTLEIARGGRFNIISSNVDLIVSGVAVNFTDPVPDVTYATWPTSGNYYEHWGSYVTFS